MTVNRRSALTGLAALAAGAAVSTPRMPKRRYERDRRPVRSRVAILHADSYCESLESILMEGLQLFDLDVRHKTILLKPNLVEFIRGTAVNTHPLLVAAAAECFRRLGASDVLVAEGPGHQRDTRLVLAQSGFERQLQELKVPFVDLNRDELVKTKLGARFTGLDHLWLPRTVLESDLVVSMPKVKTHHWAGVTLSMKNMFGVVPGLRYGWPKNLLHWKGIHHSVLDICATVPIGFVVADGIVAMEGNGPLHGAARPLNRIVLADDPVAADATCTRLMGLHPDRVPHIREGARFLGNLPTKRIDQLAECLPNDCRLFQLQLGSLRQSDCGGNVVALTRRCRSASQNPEMLGLTRCRG